MVAPELEPQMLYCVAPATGEIVTSTTWPLVIAETDVPVETAVVPK